MAITIKQLAAGQLLNNQSSWADMTIPVPANKAWVVKCIHFCNIGTSAGNATVSVYSANSPGSGTNNKTVFKISPDLAVGSTTAFTNELTLEATQKLQYKTSNNSGGFDYVVSGIERDV